MFGSRDTIRSSRDYPRLMQSRPLSPAQHQGEPFFCLSTIRVQGIPLAVRREELNMSARVDWLPPREAARELQIGVGLVYRAVRDGRVRAKWVGRRLRIDIDNARVALIRPAGPIEGGPNGN